MVDGNIQVPADSVGKKVDVSELTRADGTIVERQRAVIADDADVSPTGLAEVKNRKLQIGSPELALLRSIDDTLKRLLFFVEAALK